VICSVSAAEAACSFPDEPGPLSIAGQFVEAQRHGLAEVHRKISVHRGDAHQPVAVAEILIREAKFLAAEQQRDGRSRQRAENQASAIFEAAYGVM